MLLTIHDNQYRKVAFIDNEKQGTLNYFNDRWHRNLETGSSTFEFSVSKKDVEGDKAYSRVYQQLNEKAFVSFQHKSRNYIFYVSKVVETHTRINCLCLNLNLDLINSEVGAFKATRAMSFAEYCNAMGLLRYEKMSIGINEVSESRRTLEWDGTESKVARLISLARNFEAEIDFDTQFYDDSSLKSFKVNVYKANDGEKNQGVGRRRDDLLLVRGVNLAEVKRTVDNSKIYNALTPVGKNGERVIQLAPSSWSVKNEKGELEFYQKGGTLYAPLSAQRFPSAFPDKESGEQWITRTMEIDSADQEKIRSTAYRELKKFAYPEITYEVEGYADLNIGDTVRIQDDGFVPMLVIEARVIEQTLSFTNPSSNRTTFGNARALESRVSTDLIKRLEQMVESARPYTIKVLTSNGTYFKNRIGHSVVEARLYKGGTPIEDVTWTWEFKGQSTTGQSFQVDGREVGETAVLLVKAMQGDRELTREAVSFVNVNDGASGQPGLAGADGRTPIVHTAYANSADGSVGFSVSDSTNKSYIGTCTTYLDTNPTGEDPRDYRLYSWAKFKGETGRGIESTTHYFLATNQGSGVTASTSGWTTTAQYTSESKRYLWNYTVTQYSDGTSQTSSAIIIGVHGAKGDKGDKGNDGIAGRDGVGIRLTTVTYGMSPSDTIQPTSWSASVPTLVKGQYLWTKTVWTYTDNHTETGYQKTYISRDGNNGRDGIPGKDGVGIRSTAIAYAVSTSGTSAPTVGWGEQVPSVPSGRYLWTRTVYTYTDNDTETAYSVSKMGEKGDTGAQGVPGPKGADGRTPYVHFAYSDNADGTGLTTSDNGQRYIGHYSDYTQADSTDKTKYRWADRWAKIELGGRNYILQSDTYSTTGSKYFDVTPEFLDYAYSGKYVTISLDIKGENLVPDASGRSRIGCELRLNLSNGGNLYLQCQKIVSGNLPRERISVTRQIPQGVSVTGLNKVDMYIQVGGTAMAGRPKFELASSPSDWSPAPEDVEESIRKEAENAAYNNLKLQEQAQAIRVELEAKALASEVKAWLGEYRSFVERSDGQVAGLSQSFFESQARIVELEKNLGENALMLNFVNNYLRASEDGVTLGNKDNTDYIQITPEGIQLMSAGVAVATIANGLMKTAHGVLTDSLQVGKFRFEQSRRNPDINVWRYVE
ncbi:phage tail spike protein [Streptococcus sp. A23]|uniref:phage tail spike protein n=1 Tax=Streptococcus sp. A23 TaxID=3373127 RepID=UPI00374D83AC